MNKVKKISIILTIIILIGCIFMGTTKAAELNCNVNLSTPKNKVTYNEKFSVYVSISNLQSTKGIIAIGAVLSYDKESLTLVDIDGENKWSAPQYKLESGKLASFKNKLSTENENVFKMTFEVKEEAKSSAWVKISNFEISDGDDEKNCGGNSMTIAIGKPENENNNGNQGGSSQGGGSQGGSSQGGSNQNTGNNNQSSGSTQNNKGNNKGNTKPKEDPKVQQDNTNTNEIQNNNTINTIENVVETDTINNNNIIEDDDIQNTIEVDAQTIETKENKSIFYIISVSALVGIGIIIFIIRKYWK